MYCRIWQWLNNKVTHPQQPAAPWKVQLAEIWRQHMNPQQALHSFYGTLQNTALFTDDCRSANKRPDASFH